MTNHMSTKHLSIRVPWHDNGWNGTVCKQPKENGACLILKRIAEGKNDEEEQLIAGQSIEELTDEQRPCCIDERAMFMAPFEAFSEKTHPYSSTSPKTHGHFLPTKLRFPEYSAGIVPFRWMLKENIDEFHREYGVSVDESKEPSMSFKTVWWQEKNNQSELLDCFAQSIQPNTSLCFFYAKQVPHVEDSRRVLIGVGRVSHIGGITEYKVSDEDATKSVLWERMIQHSIRPDFSDGFILPYQQIFDYIEGNDDLVLHSMIAFAPEDHFVEFSYGTEHVTHDAAIDSLLSIAKALKHIKEHIPGPWDRCLRWIDERLTETWRMRGPYPGLGAALSAFGIELGGFVAKELETHMDDETDPWDIVDQMFEDPQSVLPASLAGHIVDLLQKTWKKLSPERKALLKLVSRLSVTADQAKIIYVSEARLQQGIDLSDEDFINNPYLIYEATRLTRVPVSIWTVDKGVFPEACIRENFPLPKPSCLGSGLDERRIRALAVHLLEMSSDNGDTLIPKTNMIYQIRELNIEPPCEVTSDMMEIAEEHFSGEIELVEMKDGSRAYQLERLSSMGKLISRAVEQRQSAKRLPTSADWRSLLDAELKDNPVDDWKMEEQARKEKSAILAEIAQSRISVLIGPAGTGKTTLLSVLARHKEIQEGGILLLAPTGKARIRMQNSVGSRAYTVAQFLSRTGRYDGSTLRYKLTGERGDPGAETVIIDECSMLTEEMLAALVEALRGVKRFILVGDPRQLPPIGPGRPFVDIVSKLSPSNIESLFPKVGSGYGELTIRRRQSDQNRADLRLAEWFSGRALSPVEDEFFDTAFTSSNTTNLRFIQWDSADELYPHLMNVFEQELGINSQDTFDLSLGGTLTDKGIYFNAGIAKEYAEEWQILSPVRNGGWGVTELNRFLHNSFRSKTIESAERIFNRKIPRPLGIEKIVYGDKVINTRNHRRSGNYVYPKEGALEYIANGEIGIAIGQFKTAKMKKAPWELKVEFSSQPEYRYSFTSSDFGEESDPTLEPAYALTIHKAQGSEFGITILVLPNPCRLLSPELLYTALTRQKRKIIILHQGPREDLKMYASDRYSEIAKRYTNLFEAPDMKEFKGVFLEERLIHRTVRGDLVRSKSEVIIADMLLNAGVIDYDYEKPLTLGGRTRYPDFTITTDIGETYYWEHCGMLQDPSYRERWLEKLKWYKANDINPYSEGEGGNLIITEDDSRGGIDSKVIKELIEKIFA